MARDRLVNLVQRDRPSRQIEVFVVQSAAPALLKLLLASFDEPRTTDRVTRKLIVSV